MVIPIFYEGGSKCAHLRQKQWVKVPFNVLADNADDITLAKRPWAREARRNDVSWNGSDGNEFSVFIAEVLHWSYGLHFHLIRGEKSKKPTLNQPSIPNLSSVLLCGSVTVTKWYCVLAAWFLALTGLHERSHPQTLLSYSLPDCGILNWGNKSVLLGITDSSKLKMEKTC